MQKKINIGLILEIDELIQILEGEKICTRRAELCRDLIINKKQKSQEEAAQILAGYSSMKEISEKARTKIYKILILLTGTNKSNVKLCEFIWGILSKVLGIRIMDS